MERDLIVVASALRRSSTQDLISCAIQMNMATVSSSTTVLETRTGITGLSAVLAARAQSTKMEFF